VIVFFREVSMPPPASAPQPPHDPDSGAKLGASARYPLLLLALFLAWWLILAIAPVYRHDWLLENLLVFIAIPLLVLTYGRLRLSNTAYTLLFVFFVLHELGAHYTYSEVPYDSWVRALSGHTLSEVLGLERNHYDRLVHFLYGLLITPAATMASMPNAMRRSKFSLNANQASNAVNTPSAFSSNEAPDAGMPVSPNINSTGPMIPPAKIAPASQGHSPEARRAFGLRRIHR